MSKRTKKKTSNIRTYVENTHCLTADQVKDAILCYIEKHAIMDAFVGEGDIEFFQECDEDETIQAVTVKIGKIYK